MHGKTKMMYILNRVSHECDKHSNILLGQKMNVCVLTGASFFATNYYERQNVLTRKYTQARGYTKFSHDKLPQKKRSRKLGSEPNVTYYIHDPINSPHNQRSHGPWHREVSTVLAAVYTTRASLSLLTHISA